jgi:hypothetical protein
MWNYQYQEENRRIGYAIIFLLFSLCLIQVSNNIESLFPKPQDNFSSFIYQDN